jgi:hypothetical protein
MKIVFSLIFLNIAFAIFIIKSSAQNRASALTTATILNPISIEKAEHGDMDFGNIAAGLSSGKVILNANGSRIAEGDILLPLTGGEYKAAEFIVRGEVSYSFAITLPPYPITLVNNTGDQTMIVSDFTSTPNTLSTLSEGKQTIKVGASLVVTGSQASGVYNSVTPFSVTVNYN